MPDTQPTPRVTADDIPTSVTRLLYSAPQINADAGVHGLSQNAFADFLAHFWPAIEQHIREQVAREIERSEFQRGPLSGSNHYFGGYTDGITDAARIARQGA